MSTKRETVGGKGWRLFVAGAVRRDGTVFTVSGDHGEYRVESGRCNCPSYSRCSHQVAAEYASGVVTPAGTVEVSAERLAELLRAEITHRAIVREENKNLIGMFA